MLKFTLEVEGGLLPKLKKAQLFSDLLYGLRSYQKEVLGQISKVLTNYVTPLYTLSLYTNIMFWNEPPQLVPGIRMDACFRPTVSVPSIRFSR